MSTQTQNILETSRMSSRLITLGAALLVLVIFGVVGAGAAMAQLEPLGQPAQPKNQEGMVPEVTPTCAAGVLPHFPLQAGNQWSYVKQGPGGAVAWQVSIASQSSGANAELQGYFGGSRTVCTGSGGVVHEVEADTGDEMWYDLGGSVGTEWQIHLDPSNGDVPDCVDGSKVTIASRTEHVDVAAGSFDNVIRVNYTPICSDGGITAEWFAPGVGLIKRIEQSFAGPVVSELQSATIGGLLLPAPSVTTSLAVDKSQILIPVTLGPSDSPTLNANLVLRNGSPQPGRVSFSGCASMTVSVIDKYGKAVITQRATDGSECKDANTVSVDITGTPLAIPVSIALMDKDGGRLDPGRYLIVATLDTLDAAPLRPSASSTFDIQYILTAAK